MRNLLLILCFALVAVATARRSVTTPAIPSTTSRRHAMDQWGYPYGWGLDDSNDLHEEEAKKITKIKEVKREIKKPKKQVLQRMRTGWFGVKYDPDHPHWMDIEDAMDGLE